MIHKIDDGNTIIVYHVPGIMDMDDCTVKIEFEEEDKPVIKLYNQQKRIASTTLSGLTTLPAAYIMKYTTMKEFIETCMGYLSHVEIMGHHSGLGTLFQAIEKHALTRAVFKYLKIEAPSLELTMNMNQDPLGRSSDN